MDIVVKKGLDIPFVGCPTQELGALAPSAQIALNLDPFDDTRFKVLVRVGDSVKIGQPLVESKATSGLYFVSPAAGVVAEVRRGAKRRLLDIVITRSEQEAYVEHGPLDLNTCTQEALLERLMVGGAFPHMRMRPFDVIANPKHMPSTIFVHAVESLPFVPAAEMQVRGHEQAFQIGLHALKRLTKGKVHLVHRKDSAAAVFTEVQGVEKHTVRGPHPAANVSLHIHKIDPIQEPSHVVWSCSVLALLVIGKLVQEGRYFIDRIVGIGGSGILEGKRGFVHTRAGVSIAGLTKELLTDRLLCLISGDPLTGTKVERDDFLGFYHTALSALEVNVQREPFHFLRLGENKFSATRTYLSGFFKKRTYDFTTNQHGEERAFIDGGVYKRVMPMRIPTMQLVKAILAEDFELATQLGLLEVAAEDFALPTFICPSKIDMMEIVKSGLNRYSKEMGF